MPYLGRINHGEHTIHYTNKREGGWSFWVRDTDNDIVFQFDWRKANYQDGIDYAKKLINDGFGSKQ